MTAQRMARAAAGASIAPRRQACARQRTTGVDTRVPGRCACEERRPRGPQMARPRRDRRSDSQLLALAVSSEPEAFTVFYQRHVDVVLAYLRRRTPSPEAAADLMAETFAAALLALHTNVEADDIEVPAAWLLGIARNKLFESYRRGRIEAAARERLGLEPLVLDDSDLALVEELSESDVVAQLADLLPPDQLQALRARVIDERDYEEIARELECSEAVVRKRVSRALRTLRARSGEEP